MAVLVGTLSQVEHLRKRLAWDAISYGLEFEAWSWPPLTLRWSDAWAHSYPTIEATQPLLLPRYAVGPAAEFDGLVNEALKDLWNAGGARLRHRYEVPWLALLDATEA
jgi:hypothetical protein